MPAKASRKRGIQYAAAYPFHRQRPGVLDRPVKPDDDSGDSAVSHASYTQTCKFAPRRRTPESFAKLFRPHQTEGAGDAGCSMHPQPGVRSVRVVRMHTSIHSGSTGNIRHPPRNGLRLIPRSPRGPIALLTPSSARRFGRRCELDACKGAPEPHGFDVRETARSSVAPFASTTARPAFVTIAIRPSQWDGMEREIA